MDSVNDDREKRLETLFRMHASDVLAYASRRGATRAEAEDVLAETLLVCWRRMEDIPADPLPWVLGVARRVLANQARSKRRRAALESKIDCLGAPTKMEPDPFEASLLGDEMRDALGKLSESDREALLLVAWEGLTHGEAAQALGLTRKGFSRRVSRARLRLMRHMRGIGT